MKKIIVVSLTMLISLPLFSATVRVYNKIANMPLEVTVISSKKNITETIPAMRSHYYNSWFYGIDGFKWKTKDGYEYEAPLSLRAIQTEGRLYIKRDGTYIFKPCLPCKESRGTAQIITSPAPEKNIPEAPPLPLKLEKIRPLPLKPEPGKKNGATPDTSTPSTDRNKLLEDIRKGKTLEPLKPTEPQTPSQQPPTLLEEIRKGKDLNKTGGPQKKPAAQHEFQKPLEDEIEKRKKYLEKLHRAQELEAEEDVDDADWDA